MLIGPDTPKAWRFDLISCVRRTDEVGVVCRPTALPLRGGVAALVAALPFALPRADA